MQRFATESSRLEAFSDGVMAVIITIMVLELHPPQTATLGALHAVLPTFAAYVLSFVFVGIYWNNHHHLLRASSGIDGRAMWANLHLLFWLSLIPFATAWIGMHPSESIPVALYGAVLLMCAVSYTILQRTLMRLNGHSAFTRALSFDLKGAASLAIYVLAIVFAFVRPAIAETFFVVVAMMWFLPDRRLERAIADANLLANPGQDRDS